MSMQESVLRIVRTNGPEGPSSPDYVYQMPVSPAGRLRRL